MPAPHEEFAEKLIGYVMTGLLVALSPVLLPFAALGWLARRFIR